MSTMNHKPPSRNRLLGMYQENAALLALDYPLLKRRLSDLSQASVRNMQAIEDLMRRLQPTRSASCG